MLPSWRYTFSVSKHQPPRSMNWGVKVIFTNGKTRKSAHILGNPKGMKTKPETLPFQRQVTRM